MSNERPGIHKSPMRKSPARVFPPGRNTRAISGQKLAESPVLLHNTLSSGIDTSSRPISRVHRPLSPTKTAGPISVRQSGSPERRLLIEGLEKRGSRSPASITPLGSNPQDLNHSASAGKPSLLDAFVPDLKRSPKKTRFAEPEAEEAEENANVNVTPPTIRDMLESISNSVKATAVSLREVSDTQKVILAEISELKSAVKALESDAKAGGRDLVSS